LIEIKEVKKEEEIKVEEEKKEEEKKKKKKKKRKKKKEESEVDDDTDDSIDEFMELERQKDRIDLSQPLLPYLIEHNISEKISNKILELGFNNLDQFRLVDINELVTKIQGKKMELTMRDDTTVTLAIKVVGDRISETDEYIDVK